MIVAFDGVVWQLAIGLLCNSVVCSVMLAVISFRHIVGLGSLRVGVGYKQSVIIVCEAVSDIMMAVLVMSGIRQVVAFYMIVLSVFIGLLVVNYVGMLPFVVAVTAHLGVALGVSVAVNMAVLCRGVARHGVRFLRAFLPVDVPVAIVGLMVPIEAVSYGLKIATLGVRLFANMTSGHILLVIVAAFGLTLVMAGIGGVAVMMLGMVFVGFLVILLGFEAMVASIQAVVFVLLSCLYIADSDETH